MTSDSTNKDKLQQHADRFPLRLIGGSSCVVFSRKHVDRMILFLAALALCEVSNFSPVWFFYANCPSVNFDPVEALETMYRRQQEQEFAREQPKQQFVQPADKIQPIINNKGVHAAGIAGMDHRPAMTKDKYSIINDPTAPSSPKPIRSIESIEHSLRESDGDSGNNGANQMNGINFDNVEHHLAEDQSADMPSVSATLRSINTKKSPGKVEANSSTVDGTIQPAATVKNPSDQKPSSLRWTNRHGIVHILTTRFMQLQPNLLHLGKARLDLFRTFTLPSVVAQTTSEFLWMIFTDPDLHPTLRQELVDMVAPYENIVVLGTNKSFKDFRTTGWTSGGLKNHVMSGDWTTVLDYRKAARTHILLETRIDADDSIFVNLMKSLQLQTVETMIRRPPAVSSGTDHQSSKDEHKKEFRVFCTESHLEWGYFNPWQKESQIGHLFGITEKKFCISAGLTYAYHVNTSPNDLPTKAHNQLDKKLPVCGSSGGNLAITMNCLDRIRPVMKLEADASNKTALSSSSASPEFTMLRSRTPTSAGMQGVIPTMAVRNSKDWPHRQNATWAILLETFGVSPASIHALRRRFAENMEDILSDALAGQCVKAEFTCKQTTQTDLKALLEQVRANS